MYQPEYRHKLDAMLERFPVFTALPLPVTEAAMEEALRLARDQA
jgi:hypothetical protein